MAVRWTGLLAPEGSVLVRHSSRIGRIHLRRLSGDGRPILPSSQRKVPRVTSSYFNNTNESITIKQGAFQFVENSSPELPLIRKELSLGKTSSSAPEEVSLLRGRGLKALLTKDFWTVQSLLSHLMPRDYKRTCMAGYENYAKATMASSMLGTAASVLSMQALLTSVGVSAQSSLPLAATLNWVLKDGLGQIGGVIFAATVNTRFDADPKRFRFGADAVLATSVVLESCTVLIPWLFLPLASVANVGKNAAWLSASATRASIHQSFCLEHNLADVTGKAGSQTITASVAGTALGIAVTPLLSNDALSIILATTVFSMMHLTASYRALHYVQLKTLNIQRAWLALSPALVSYRFKENASGSTKPMTTTMNQSSLCGLDWDKLDVPENVAIKERILHFGKWGSQDGRAKLASPPTAQNIQETPAPSAASPDSTASSSSSNTNNSNTPMQSLSSALTFLPYLKSSLHVNPRLDDVSSASLKQMMRICDAFDDQHFIQVVVPDVISSGEFTVRLFYLADATPADVLAGFLHAALIIRALGRMTQAGPIQEGSDSSSFNQLIYDVRDRMQRENACAKFYYGIQDKGWDIKHVFIEERKENRVRLLNRPRKPNHQPSHFYHPLAGTERGV